MNDELNGTTQQPESPQEPGNVPPPPPPVPETPPPPPQLGTSVGSAGGLRKADLLKRFIAAVIDAVLAGIVSFVPVIGGLVGAAYMLLRDGLEIDFMDGRSLGKKIMKLRPVRLDGGPMDIATSVKRNIPFAIGPVIMIVPVIGWIIGPMVAIVVDLVESVLVLTDPQGRRIGDKMAETMVIEVDE